MSESPSLPQPPSTEELVALGEAVRRVARSRGADPSTAEDIAQETLTRLMTVGERLETSARLPWAMTTAGNLIVNLYRDEGRHRRHRHRLIDVTHSVSHPESDAIAREEAHAVRVALDGLDESERQMLMQHVDGASTIDLAAASESTPGAVAARLHRTRARMRLDYLLALRRVELPTPACRRVLLAISAADVRRQQALDTDEHLAACATCADLVLPLAQRNSRLAGIALAPLVVLGAWGGRVTRAAHTTAFQATAATAAAAAGAGIYFATQSDPPPQQPQPVAQARIPALRTAAGTDLLRVSRSTLQTFTGQRVSAQRVIVQAAVSPPGFWVGPSSVQRIYVHMTNPNGVSHRVQRGQHVTFTGVLDANGPKSDAAAEGVSGPEGAGLLTLQGVHITVDGRDVEQG